MRAIPWVPGAAKFAMSNRPLTLLPGSGYPSPPLNSLLVLANTTAIGPALLEPLAKTARAGAAWFANEGREEGGPWQGMESDELLAACAELDNVVADYAAIASNEADEEEDDDSDY